MMMNNLIFFYDLVKKELLLSSSSWLKRSVIKNTPLLISHRRKKKLCVEETERRKKKNLKLLKCHLPSQLRCLASISGRATSCSSCAREKKTSICVRDECGLRSRSAYHQRNPPPSPLDIYFTCRWCTRQRTKPRGNHRIDPVTPYPRERVTLQSVPGAPLEGR